jgi:hypothetical protein
MTSLHSYECISQTRIVLSRDPVIILYLMKIRQFYVQHICQFGDAICTAPRFDNKTIDLLVELNTVNTVEVAVKIYRLGFSASPVCLEFMSYSINVFPGLFRLDCR